MKKLTTFCLTVGLMCMLLCAPVSAQSAVITQIDFANGNAVAEENLSLSGYGDKDSGYAASMGGGRIYASVSGTDLRKLEWSKGEYGDKGMQPVMTGGTKNPWGKGAYLEIRLPAAGYENITFSASIGATNKGPRDYKLQYSVNGSTFKDVPGATFTVTTNKTLFAAFDNVALPAETADCSLLYIRIAVASNMLVNGTAGLIGSTGGETAVNHVTVCATPIATTTTKAQTTSATDTAVSVTETSATTATNNGTSTTTPAKTPTSPTTRTTVSDAQASATTAASSVLTTTTVKAQTTSDVSSADTDDVSQAGIAFGMLIVTGILVIMSATTKKQTH